VWWECRTHPGTPCVTPKLGGTQGGLPHGGDEPPSVGLPQGQRGIQVLGCLKIKEEFKCWLASMPRGSLSVGLPQRQGEPKFGLLQKEVTCHLAPKVGSLLQLGFKT
jgi:hypothetical protein